MGNDEWRGGRLNGKAAELLVYELHALFFTHRKLSALHFITCRPTSDWLSFNFVDRALIIKHHAAP